MSLDKQDKVQPEPRPAHTHLRHRHFHEPLQVFKCIVRSSDPDDIEQHIWNWIIAGRGCIEASHK